jgi:hypothetical protein
MKNKRNIQLPLTEIEKASLRKNKIKIADILDFAPDELEVLLNATNERAKEIYALAEFQTVPSVGIKFAEDLVFLVIIHSRNSNKKTAPNSQTNTNKKKAIGLILALKTNSD